jgi:hypothetical protein
LDFASEEGKRKEDDELIGRRVLAVKNVLTQKDMTAVK